MTEDIAKQISDLCSPLFSDILDEDEFYNRRPLLAHYTNLKNLENIVASEEIWFSNPLFMNDIEEIRFGIVRGVDNLILHEGISRALGTEDRVQNFHRSLEHYKDYYDENHVFDTYVFCLSEHKNGNDDGTLSMWRGYGDNGNGAALIFDSSKIEPMENTPLIVARVHYESEEKRVGWMSDLGDKIAEIFDQNEIPDTHIYVVAHQAFERLKLFSLFTKHIGFSEENEWRIVYFSDRDNRKFLEDNMHYLNGDRGVEPKLRVPVRPFEGVISEGVSFENILHAIILGPSNSTPLQHRSVKRMLEVRGKATFADRLRSSSIPFRPSR